MRMPLQCAPDSHGASGSGVRDGNTAGKRSGLKLRSGPPKVLLVLGHPRKSSFCEALADAYAAGAQIAGAELQRNSLSESGLEPNVLVPSPCDQPLEPDFSRAAALIKWADTMAWSQTRVWIGNPPELRVFLVTNP